MTKPVRISYWFVLGTFVLVGVLHLGTPLLAALFSYFLLQKLHLIRSRWLAITLFSLLVLAGSLALARFTGQAVVALPAVAEKAIPSVIDYAETQGIELPFTDWASLKVVALDTAKAQLRTLGAIATFATRELVFLLIGIVVAVSLFLNRQIDIDRDKHPLANNLYSLTTEAIGARFRNIYLSFTAVMGAQILISGINTALTAVFVLASGLPYAAVLIGVTFLCGMLPVIGNLISNTIITAVAFTVSPRTALFALIFLVLVHKLEYFLNSKIIGDRIRNPVWLTLLGLLLGETLMGVPGMILAPVLLNYIKAEALSIEVEVAPAAEGEVGPRPAPRAARPA